MFTEQVSKGISDKRGRNGDNKAGQHPLFLLSSAATKPPVEQGGGRWLALWLGKRLSEGDRTVSWNWKESDTSFSLKLLNPAFAFKAPGEL